MNPIISFLSDFGTTDTSVGQCKGVIASITPKATVIDITHAVPHFDIATGAWLLRNAVPHFPPCVHVAVVDPGVGTPRRAIALECGRGDILIGPDNGLLGAAATVLGGVTGAVELNDPRFHHQPVSRTFHARDIFCPAAAHIVHGVGVHTMGQNIDPSTLMTLAEPASEVRDGTVYTQVAAINEFGSLALAAEGALLQQLGSPNFVQAQVDRRTLSARVVSTFGDSAEGEIVLLVDSYGRLCLARNQGSLAALLDLTATARPEVTLQASSGNPH